MALPTQSNQFCVVQMTECIGDVSDEMAHPPCGYHHPMHHLTRLYTISRGSDAPGLCYLWTLSFCIFSLALAHYSLYADSQTRARACEIVSKR